MLLRSLALTTILFAAFLGELAVSTPTRAQVKVIDLTCLGDSRTAYEPGLTNTPQEVVATQKGRFHSCSSSTRPNIISGTWERTFTGTFSCADVQSGSAAAGPRTFRWNTGESSLEDMRRITARSRRLGQTVNVTEGRITEGVFAGDATRDEDARPNTDLTACETPDGLQNTGGPRIIGFFAPV